MKYAFFLMCLATGIFFSLRNNLIAEAENLNKKHQSQPKLINMDTPLTTIRSKSKKGFKIDIENQTLNNNNFRKVLYTAKNLQLVIMSLKPGEEIGSEVHSNTDQFFRFESGNGKFIINESTYLVKNGDVIIVPAGSKHNIINSDLKEELKLYTVYSPPQHKDGIVISTKKEAESQESKFDGKTTE